MIGQWAALVFVAVVLLIYAFADTSPRGHRISFWTVVVALVLLTAMEAR